MKLADMIHNAHIRRSNKVYLAILTIQLVFVYISSTCKQQSRSYVSFSLTGSFNLT